MTGRFPLGVLGLGLTALGASQTPGPIQADVVGTYESLSGGLPDWRSLQVSFAKPLGPRRSVYAVGRLAERFERTDRQVTLGAYTPVRRGLTSLVEVSYSPTQELLPRWAGTAQLAQELGRGWVVTGGVSRTVYRTDETTGFVAGVERYFRNYRVAYFLNGGFAREAGFAAGHRISLNQYLDDRTSWGVTLGLGEEVESVGPGQVLRTAVFGVGVGGRIGVGRNGAILADVGYVRQGNLYVRRALTLGYRHAF
jgi:YaiO family outer membrane protein